jgi:hypothetical protein
MSYLEGDQMWPASTKKAKELIGKNVKYLRGVDIDHSGRGMFFPRTGKVEEIYARNIRIDGDWLTFSQIKEIVINPETII